MLLYSLYTTMLVQRWYRNYRDENQGVRANDGGYGNVYKRATRFANLYIEHFHIVILLVISVDSVPMDDSGC